jgi:phospholipase/lecithinase/hemolysin
MQRFLARLFLSVLVTGAWAASPSAQETAGPPFTNLWAFGDSLTDTGNLFYVTSDIEPPSPLYFEGRHSDGPLWIEVFAPLLGLDVDFDTPFANNQAIGGAYTDTRGVVIDDTGVLSQVYGFLGAGGVIGEDDLVVIWAGANNYFGGDKNPAHTVADLAEAVEELAFMTEASTFVVLNLPNLGDTPAGEASGLSHKLNSRTNSNNAVLSDAMAELSWALDIEIIVIDINTGFAAVLEDPEAFGFFNVSVPCLVQQPDGSRIVTGACPPDGAGSYDATGTLFWDLIHPTSAAHALLAVFTHGALTAEFELPDTIDERQKLVNLMALAQVRAYANAQQQLLAQAAAE